MIERLERCARGTVMIETIIAFMPTFTLFLGIVQHCLLAAAELVVHHAAVAGVRSASVVLDDDPARYDGAHRLSLTEGQSEDVLGDFAAITAAVLGSPPQLDAVPAALGQPRPLGARLGPIRTTVYAKLAAIVPARAVAAMHGQPGVSVLDGLGEHPELRLLQAPLWLPITTAITFPRAPGDTALYEDHVPAGGPLTLRVTHITTCTVPIAAALMCPKLKDVLSSESNAKLAAELAYAPAASGQSLRELSELRVKVLQAEATLPLQSATYPYASEAAGGSAGAAP